MLNAFEVSGSSPPSGLDTISESILAYLRDAAGFRSIKDITAAVRCRRQTLFTTLHRLEESGKIISSGEGRRGNPTRFTLAPAATSGTMSNSVPVQEVNA